MPVPVLYFIFPVSFGFFVCRGTDTGTLQEAYTLSMLLSNCRSAFTRDSSAEGQIQRRLVAAMWIVRLAFIVLKSKYANSATPGREGGREGGRERETCGSGEADCKIVSWVSFA